MTDGPEAVQQSTQRRRTGNWAGKANVIEQLNELVAELKDIDCNIALHVSCCFYSGSADTAAWAHSAALDRARACVP
jgi:hypothetical protein